MISTTGRVFVDTNILVYCYDLSDPSRHAIARGFLNELCTRGDAVISTQVMSEFFVVATRRIPKPLSSEEARQLLTSFTATMTVLDVNSKGVLLAIEQGVSQGLSYWDALIWATARLAGVSTVCSEDFTHGRSVGGVRFVNPFQA